MAGFRKAKCEQAALKMGFYGPPGSGKTFTALMCAEGLAKLAKKRVAYCDTEHGTSFYCQTVKERSVHPEAFDFDAIYTRSLSEIDAAIRGLNPAEYSVIVIDSITHVWEAAIAAYSGRTTKIGTLPFHAWGSIKKPYKSLIAYLLSSPIHVFLCGRQGNVFEEDEETGETKKIGVKMKAEGETAYEPHILLRMEATLDTKLGISYNTAFAEKDRTGILSGKTIHKPGYDTLIKPLLGLLGATQAKVETTEDVGTRDAEVFDEQEMKREENSKLTLEEFTARITLTKSMDDLKAISKEITPELKRGMISQHVSELREKYLEAEKRFKVTRYEEAA
jgi:hypothetical protein